MSLDAPNERRSELSRPAGALTRGQIAARVLPAVVSCLLAAAHVLRTGNLVVMALLVLAPLLLLVRRRASLLALRVLLFLITLEWLRTLFLLGRARLEAGQPYLRMTAILLAVAALAALSARWLGSQRLKDLYRQ